MVFGTNCFELLSTESRSQKKINSFVIFGALHEPTFLRFVSSSSIHSVESEVTEYVVKVRAVLARQRQRARPFFSHRSIFIRAARTKDILVLYNEEGHFHFLK